MAKEKKQPEAKKPERRRNSRGLFLKNNPSPEDRINERDKEMLFIATDVRNIKSYLKDFTEGMQSFMKKEMKTEDRLTGGMKEMVSVLGDIKKSMDAYYKASSGDSKIALQQSESFSKTLVGFINSQKEVLDTQGEKREKEMEADKKSSKYKGGRGSGRGRPRYRSRNSELLGLLGLGPMINSFKTLLAPFELLNNALSGTVMRMTSLLGVGSALGKMGPAAAGAVGLATFFGFNKAYEYANGTSIGEDPNRERADDASRTRNAVTAGAAVGTLVGGPAGTLVGAGTGIVVAGLLEVKEIIEDIYNLQKEEKENKFKIDIEENQEKVKKRLLEDVKDPEIANNPEKLAETEKYLRRIRIVELNKSIELSEADLKRTEGVFDPWRSSKKRSLEEMIKERDELQKQNAPKQFLQEQPGLLRDENRPEFSSPMETTASKKNRKYPAYTETPTIGDDFGLDYMVNNEKVSFDPLMQEVLLGNPSLFGNKENPFSVTQNSSEDITNIMNNPAVSSPEIRMPTLENPQSRYENASKVLTNRAMQESEKGSTKQPVVVNNVTNNNVVGGQGSSNQHTPIHFRGTDDRVPRYR